MVLDYGGFVLVGDVQCGDMMWVDLFVVEQFGQCGIDVGEDFVWVMFDLVGLWEDLCKFVLCVVDDVVGMVEQDCV